MPFFDNNKPGDTHKASDQNKLQAEVRRLGKITGQGPIQVQHNSQGIKISMSNQPFNGYWSSWEGTGGTYSNGTNAFTWNSPNTSPTVENDIKTTDFTNFTSQAGGTYWISAVGNFGCGSSWDTLCTVQNPQGSIAQVNLQLVLSPAAGGSSTIKGTTCVIGKIGTIGLNTIVDPNGGGYYELNPTFSSGFGGSTPTNFMPLDYPPGVSQINTLIKMVKGDAFKINVFVNGTSSQSATGWGNSLTIFRVT